MTLKDRLKKFDLLPQIDDAQKEDISLAPDKRALYNEIAKVLSEKIASIPVWFDYTEDEQKSLILSFLNAKFDEKFSNINLTEAEKEKISAMFLNSVYGFGSLDFLIAQKDISTIFVNSPENVCIEKGGQILKADVTIDIRQFETMLKKLSELSGCESSIVKFRFKNLLITIIREPISRPKLIFKKISDANFDLAFLEEKRIINTDISHFLLNALKNRKNILITGEPDCGKTIFLNSILNEFHGRGLLFEDVNLINTENQDLLRFNIYDKSVENILLDTVYSYNPDYLFFDSNMLDFSFIMNGDIPFVASIRAYSPFDIIPFYINLMAKNFRCSKKTAKSILNKCFDYIIHVSKTDGMFVINYILELSLTESDTPVLEELLTFQSGEYKYDFPHVVNPPEKLPSADKKLSFSSRLKMKQD